MSAEADLPASGSEAAGTTLAKRFAWVCSRASSKADLRNLQKLCEVVKSYMVSKAHQLVAEAGHMPVLVTYASDGTPLRVRQRMVLNAGVGSVTAARGKATDEYLVQIAFLRYLDIDGQSHNTVVMREPLALTHGKSAMALFAAGQGLLPPVRSMGHLGVSVSHFSFDRGCYSALFRVFKQSLTYEASKATAQPGIPESNPKLQFLLDWVVGTPCAMHDVHNSLRWSLYTQFADTQMMKDMHIILESLRNSSNLIWQSLGAWLGEVLVFKPDTELPEAEVLELLWTALGVEPELVDLLANTFRLTWAGGQLQVAATCMSDPAFMEQLSATLLAVWQFTAFTETRWISVGTSCRCFTFGLLTGIESLVAKIRQDPRCSDFHIHGFARLTPGLKEMVVQCAFISYVPESCLSELAADARVGLRLEELKQAVKDEVLYLANLEESVWALAGQACHLAGRELRSKVLYGAHTAIGFMTQQLFAPARQYPWCLGGDVPSNLEALAAGPEPPEAVSSKIWRLMHMGYNKQQLVAGVNLLMQCSWSTSTAEQLRASAALARRHHPDYQPESLVVRSFVHSLRGLLPGISPEARQWQKSMHGLQALQARQPERINGRHIFVKELAELAKTKASSSASPEALQHIRRTIWRKHGQRWDAMSRERRAYYEEKAAKARAQARADIEARTTEAKAALEVGAMRVKEAQALEAQGPMLLSACRWTAKDEQNIADLMGSAKFNDGRVVGLRAQASQAPSLPSAADQAALAQMPVAEVLVPPLKQQWLASLCHNREAFAGCILLFPSRVPGLSACPFLFCQAEPPVLLLRTIADPGGVPCHGPSQ